MTSETFESVAGVLGNVLEWYDFALFGFFSDIIAENFFPPQSGNSALVQSFAIFGGAFLMRPIGGLTIGYIGDKHGRKTALSFSLMLMGIPTFCMGCLPTYEMAGGWSIFLLAVARLLQGLSVGGQLPASLVYTVEKRPRLKWGYYGSFVMLAANMGSLLGNLVGAILRDVLTEEQLRDWGWRLPFLSGILIAFVGCYLKLHGTEHHPNAGVYDHQDSQITNPIKQSFRRENRMALVACALTPMIWASGFYLSFVWMAIFMQDLVTPSISNAFWINLATLFFGLTIFLPLAGYISDKLGRVKLMTVGTLSLGVLGPLMVVVIASGNSAKAFVAQWVIGVTLSLVGGPMCSWLVENFSPQVRLTSASLGYDIAHAVAAGFSPIWATLMVDRVGVRSPGIIYSVFAAISLIGLYTMKCQQRAAGQDTQQDIEKEVEFGGASTTTDGPPPTDQQEVGNNLNPIT